MAEQLLLVGTVVKSNDTPSIRLLVILSVNQVQRLHLGASGDTINLASGASQSGFGRTGTVDWQTTPKTATFTAVSGEGYFCNTSGGALQLIYQQVLLEQLFSFRLCRTFANK